MEQHEPMYWLKGDEGIVINVAHVAFFTTEEKRSGRWVLQANMAATYEQDWQCLQVVLGEFSTEEIADKAYAHLTDCLPGLVIDVSRSMTDAGWPENITEEEE